MGAGGGGTPRGGDRRHGRRCRRAWRGGETAEAPPPLLTNPAQAVTEICDLLRRTLGQAPLRLRCDMPDLHAFPAAVRGDRAELEAALINLVVNARDAMPTGGDITVRGAVERVAEAPPHPAGLAPGRHLRLAVADTGSGMDAETLARATEAFFTTKPRGRGTGLGLATVRAFAEGVGGGVRIESTPGRGTTVTLWLPEAAGDQPP